MTTYRDRHLAGLTNATKLAAAQAKTETEKTPSPKPKTTAKK